MIVTITSCAPVRALSSPTTQPTAAPPTKPPSTQTTTCTTTGMLTLSPREVAGRAAGGRPAADLALAADVEHSRLVRERAREPGQDERRGLDAGLRERVEDRAEVAVVNRRAERRLLEQRRDRVRVEDRALEH